jgi:hypothetical protein
MVSKALFVFGSILFALSGAFAEQVAPILGPSLVTYPGPAGLAPSGMYSVTVRQRGSAQASFVYAVNNIGLAQFNWQQHGWNNSAELNTSWTTFDFSDPGATRSAPGSAPVTVQVSMTAPSPAWKAPAVRILPSSLKIVPGSVVASGNTLQVSFEIRVAAQYSVEFYDAAANPDFSIWVPENPLLLFANPIERDVPSRTAKNVRVLTPADTLPVSGSWGTQNGVAVDTLYFTPGIYDLGLVPSTVNTGIYVLHSGQTIYIAGGAYIKGAFVTCPNPFMCSDAQNIAVRGRGVLSGENFKRDIDGASFDSLADDVPALIQFQGTDIAGGTFQGQQNAVIEGLTFVQAPFDNIYLNGIDNRVSNVKVISWYPSTDGIKVGLDYLIDGVEHPGHGIVENSFLKDGDDSIHLYSTGLRVNNVVIWQSKNASPFEFGSGTSGSIDDVLVTHSTVIHTEWNWPNMANAVFAANLGGTGDKGYGLGYTFDGIDIENSAWQLFRLSIVPTIWQFGNTELGSLRNLKFRNMAVADAQALPSLFKSYDPVHRISNVSFENVVVAGEVQAQPTISFDANRSMSLSGDIITEPVWANPGGAADPNVQIWMMAQGEPSSSPVTSVLTLDEPFLDDPQLELLRRGDFFGDGFASPLIIDPAEDTLGVWAEPLNPDSASGRLGYFIAAEIPAGYAFAGVGDFTGAGISDVLLWNDVLQQGLILTMQGCELVPIGEIRPSDTSSTWHVAGIGDFDLNGISDVLLRDPDGNLEILYMSASGVSGALALAPAQLTFVATPLFEKNNPQLPFTGTFDASWQIAGVGAINNYAAILWANALGEVGMTQFIFPSERPYGNVFATLPAGSHIQGLGDFNGDGSIDLLLRDTGTGLVSIWYLGFMGGNYYLPAPATGIQMPGSWQD